MFGIIHRKLLRGGNFTSVTDLESQLREFMDYYNTTMAHPFAWTYTASRCRSNAVSPSSHRTAASNWGKSSDWRKPPPYAMLFERCGYEPLQTVPPPLPH